MSKKRLLIIEDDVDVAEMLVTYFNGQGYHVIHSDQGMDGVKAARAQFPNLILLDLMLPDMTGFEVCRMLRTTNLTKFIPIIFLTQRDGRADKLESFEIGADDYVTKPFDIEELRLRIKNSITRATRDNLHETRTGLPTGSLVKSEYVRTLYEETGDWHYLHINLQNFDAYRDKYGFIAADEALAITGQLIANVVGEHGTPSDFVGTDAEASFVVYTLQQDVSTLEDNLRQQFQARIEPLYSFEDIGNASLMMHFDISPFTMEA